MSPITHSSASFNYDFINDIFTSIPVPTPKSPTNLSEISSFCAAVCIIHAAIWGAVGICSSSIRGALNSSTADRADSRCLSFIRMI